MTPAVKVTRQLHLCCYADTSEAEFPEAKLHPVAVTWHRKLGTP